jgi:hypothetical protein
MKHDQDPLAFPDIIAGAAGDFSDIYCTVLEVPPHFMYISYLTCLGSVLGPRVTLNSELRPSPRTYVILLGESADDRKSTALSKTTAFFRDTLTDFGICWGIGSAEGLQRLMEKNESLLLCFDEFKQFISKCRIDGSVLLPCVNTLFEATRYENVTSKSEIRLERAFLSLLGASTIQTYERCWDASFTDIGFNNRLFIVPGGGEKRFSFPQRVSFNDLAWLKKRLGDVLGHYAGEVDLDITDEGREIYHNWYMNLERSIHAKRLDTYALRFMILLAVNELKDEIDAATVSKVCKLMDWQLQVRKLHDPIDADGQTAKMEERIRRILKLESLSEHDLKKKLHTERTGIWVYTMAMRNLQQAREIRWNKVSKTWGIT